MTMSMYAVYALESVWTKMETKLYIYSCNCDV